MLFNSYTSVSRLINTEPSELLSLLLSEPIASESVGLIELDPKYAVYRNIGAEKFRRASSLAWCPQIDLTSPVPTEGREILPDLIIVKVRSQQHLSIGGN